MKKNKMSTCSDYCVTRRSALSRLAALVGTVGLGAFIQPGLLRAQVSRPAPEAPTTGRPSGSNDTFEFGYARSDAADWMRDRASGTGQVRTFGSFWRGEKNMGHDGDTVIAVWRNGSFQQWVLFRAFSNGSTRGFTIFAYVYNDDFDATYGVQYKPSNSEPYKAYSVQSGVVQNHAKATNKVQQIEGPPPSWVAYTRPEPEPIIGWTPLGGIAVPNDCWTLLILCGLTVVCCSKIPACCSPGLGLCAAATVNCN